MMLLSLIFLVLSQGAMAQNADHGQQISAHEPGMPRIGWSFKKIGQLPIHHDGRLMPLDSYARAVVLEVTAKRSYQNWEPMELLFSWVAFPEQWTQKDIFRIGHHELKRQLLMDEKQNQFSPQFLMQNAILMQYAQSMAQGDKNQVGMRTETKANPRSTELNRVLNGLQAFRGISSGESWKVIPGPKGHWKPLRDDLPSGQSSVAATPAPDEAQQLRDREIRRHFGQVILAYYQGDQKRFDNATDEAIQAIQRNIAEWSPHEARKIQLESFYNHSRPFKVAWIFYLVGALLYFLMTLKTAPGFWWRKSALGMLVVGFTFHVIGFAIRVYVSGRPPVSNMYESIVWVAWGILIFAFLLYWRTQKIVVMASGSLLAAFSLIAADAAPAMMNPGIQSLVPVLRSNYWLIIHVLTITLSYAAFALSLGISNVTLWKFWHSPKAATEIRDLNQLSYRSMQFGVVLLAAGTILGGVWADESWGRFWGWDPKETWAFIALLMYLALLHARMFGFVGQFGYAAWSVLCFLSVIMAWYGVNFILGVGLHSYGFATGGTNTVLSVCGLQSLYVLIVSMRHYGWLARFRSQN